MSTDFSGLSVALATPFTPAGNVDGGAFRRLVRHVATGGANTLVVLGTSGEAPTLEDAERDLVIELCLEERQGLPVLVGTGTNSTRQTARWTKRAHALGAQGALVVTPYYNKPMAAGLIAHYAAVAEAAPGFPLVVYNVPGRTGITIPTDVLARLWENPQLVALKESSGNLSRMAEIAHSLPKNKLLLCGDDNLAVHSIAVGASGLVSVIGNLLPRETRAMVDAARAGHIAEAQRLESRLHPLMEALFVESNPIPLKAALAIIGLCEAHVRLPLTMAERSTFDTLRVALAAAAGALEEAAT